MSEDMSKECLSLGDGEAEEAEGDFCDRNIEDGGHSELGEGDASEAPYIPTSYLWWCWSWIAFASPLS